MLIQTSPHLHYRYTNVQLYNQKYVRLLGYIIDTDQTSKQENTTNLYICKVYTKYTLYIYRSKTKSRVGFFFLMLNNQILPFNVNRKKIQQAVNSHTHLALRDILGAVPPCKTDHTSASSAHQCLQKERLSEVS